MLSLLKIENIAVIESVEINFSKGFNVLSGETGAGKSIIIDSIHIILGERITRDIIRTGEKRASVYAKFTDVYGSGTEASDYLRPDGLLCLSREITADGKNICKINGVTVSTVLLRELGEELVDIHGQHDSRNLLDPERHIVYLDSFAGLSRETDAYYKEYILMQKTAQSIKTLKMDEAEKLRRIEMLKYQINEIELAALSPDEDEKLNQKKSTIINAEKLNRQISAAANALISDESKGAIELLEEARYQMSLSARISQKFETYANQLSEIIYTAEDIGKSLRDETEEILLNKSEINEIEERLDLIYRLKRKYGNSISDMMRFLDEARKELNQIELADENRQILAEKYAEYHTELINKADIISEKRHHAAEELAQKIKNELKYLDMPDTNFSVEFYLPEENGQTQLNKRGRDNVEFFMSVNKGENMKQLSKTASGGELSRIMLALKNVLAAGDNVPVMIFDEIDTGISGRAAQRVAEKLWNLSIDRQVLCVTHLSQLSAMADENYLIEKGIINNRTSTKVIKLDSSGRCAEIARINTGENANEITLESARQQLMTAVHYKESILKEKRS